MSSILYYNDFNNINIDEEILKIENANIAFIRIDTKNKGLLFLLGLLFAAGKNIIILNKEELEKNGAFSDETYFKSYPKMAYVWELLGNPGFNFSRAETSLEKNIADVKRLRVGVQKVVNSPLSNHIFLICPVRDASEEQRQEMKNYKKNMMAEGYSIHVPHLDTYQNFDLLGGYSICCQNADALAKSQAVHIYYDQRSQGSMFDLGIAYYLNKKLYLLNGNSIEFNKDDFGDDLILNWMNRENKSRNLSKLS